MNSALNDALTARGRKLGIEEWPYGIDSLTAREKMIEWAERHDLRYAETIGRQCPHWLIRNNSRNVARRFSKRGSFLHDNTDHSECSKLYHLDHVTAWLHNGKPEVVVSQPYNLEAYHLANLGALEQLDLKVMVHGRGWYGHGTVCVEIWSTSSDLFDVDVELFTLTRLCHQLAGLCE
jgi:hypothetical protein